MLGPLPYRTAAESDAFDVTEENKIKNALSAEFSASPGNLRPCLDREARSLVLHSSRISSLVQMPNGVVPLQLFQVRLNCFCAAVISSHSEVLASVVLSLGSRAVILYNGVTYSSNYPGQRL